MSLETVIAGLRLRNPVLSAPGPYGFTQETAILSGLRRLGGFVTKSITVEPRRGNPPPRLAVTPAGMLNAIGLENPGIEAFIAHDLPRLRHLDMPVIVSIAGSSVAEYALLAERLTTAGVDAVEVNVSCPNTEDGMIFGSEPRAAAGLVGAVRHATPLPVWVKLTPNVTDIAAIARAVEDAGADALALINTVAAMAVDVEARTPVLGAISGGLSGPAIRPVAVYQTWRAATAVKVPVIGMGGIETAEDALEFLIVGARGVAIGSAIMRRPAVIEEVLDGLEAYLRRHRLRDISEVVGSLHVPVSAPHLHRPDPVTMGPAVGAVAERPLARHRWR
ncbi:MAG: dihydroorotate dehydrogenase [Armatimonadetes bacterium]|nr:dihydroorotate dehydrogenase [Armatimonadota bacterium]